MVSPRPVARGSGSTQLAPRFDRFTPVKREPLWLGAANTSREACQGHRCTWTLTLDIIEITVFGKRCVQAYPRVSADLPDTNLCTPPVPLDDGMIDPSRCAQHQVKVLMTNAMHLPQTSTTNMNKQMSPDSRAHKCKNLLRAETLKHATLVGL